MNGPPLNQSETLEAHDPFARLLVGVEGLAELFKNKWRHGARTSPDGENITVGQVADYLGDNDTIDINVSELMRARDPKEHRQEKERVEAASLEFPIIVVKSGDKYRYILDGNHRLQKAINMGIETIKTKILDLDDTETPEMFVRVFGFKARAFVGGVVQ